MQANELRQKYLEFFKAKGHRVIPPAPLIPTDDATTLFTSSGMQPLVPYLKGEAHPMGTRLVDIQLSFRAEDIEEVGDNRHTTFFEMMGNWSLGDYFKPEQLAWFWEFLTREIGLDPSRLYVTVFAGNEAVPRDEESMAVWQEIFQSGETGKSGESGFDPKVKIYTYGADKNWWSRAGTPDKMPPGEIGGPDSEVFYDYGPDRKLHEQSRYRDQPCHPNCDCGRFIEVGNSVFMEYVKTNNGFERLPKKNVDFGGGLERTLAALNGDPDIFKTTLCRPVVAKISRHCGQPYQGNEPAFRIITDHLRAAVFMMAEGLEPGNKLQGYVLRRLLRRAAVKMHELTSGKISDLSHVVDSIMAQYEGVYFQNMRDLGAKIKSVLSGEIQKFGVCLGRGMKEFEKAAAGKLSTSLAFDLWQSYGFPVEVTAELFRQKGVRLDKTEFDRIFQQHQDLSRTAAAGIFKGGLADHSEAIVRLHTATHLLHAALIQVLGDHVRQVGSNITAERLRFDFTHPQALKKEQLEEIEKLVNQKITENLPVTMGVMPLQEAQKQGALAFFSQKYPEQVKVYTVKGFSMELCGGPHVDFTGKLGRFMIKKEEAVGSGKRRIYGVLEP